MQVSKFKQRLVSVLPKNAFARGVSVLVGGTVGAQALMVLASPLLTRLYTPEDFGLLAVYASILSLFTVIASLRYELAIPLPEKDIEALNLVKLCLIMILFITMLSVSFVFLAGEKIAVLVNNPRLENYLWLLPIGVFSIGCYQAFNYWALRTKAFTVIAKTKIFQSLINLTLQISLFKLSALALILGQVGGQAIGVSTLAKSAIKSPDFKSWKFQDLKNIAIRYKKFPIFSTWEGFVNTAGSQLPPLFFAIFFSAGAAGMYALAHRVLAMPMSLIGSAVGNVFLSNAASAYRLNQLAPLFEQVYSKLVSIIMPIMLILIIDAPQLFSLVFGESWREAGEIARWMTPWLAIVFIASPLSTLFSIMEKQKQGMYFQAVMLIMRVVGIMLGYHYQSMIIAVALFSLLSASCWVGFLIWACLESKSSLIKMIWPLIKYSLYSLLCVSPLIFIATSNYDFIFWCVSLGVTGFFCFFYYYSIFKGAYF